MKDFLRDHFGDPIELLFRILLGGAFVLAGTLKAIDPIEFTQSVRAYEIIGDPWAACVALGLPWLEIFCGLAIVLRVLFGGAVLLVCGMLAFFIVAICSVWIRGINVECGCFGKALPVESYGMNLLIDGSLLLIGIGLLIGERNRQRKADVPG